MDKRVKNIVFTFITLWICYGLYILVLQGDKWSFKPVYILHAIAYGTLLILAAIYYASKMIIETIKEEKQIALDDSNSDSDEDEE